MPLTLEVDSIPYEGFTSANVRLSLDSLAHDFRFTATAERANYLPFTGGESCRILINNEVVTTGFIEIVDVPYSAGSHTINIQGRSKTGDIVDSTLDQLELNAPITLKNCIQKVIEQLGSDITVTDQSGSEPFNESEDKLGPSVGQNAFEFIVTLAKKRQVLLTTDKDGNILITRSESTSTNSSLLNQVNGENNNIISARASYDHTNRFNKYLVKSQLNASSSIFGGVTDLNSVVNQGGSSITDFVLDPLSRVGRQLVLRAEKASSTEQASLRATWEANIRRARSSNYSATIRSFSDNSGARWSLNTVVNVIDDFTNINANKLINSIEFSTTLNGGDVTQLGMVETDAYQVSLEEPKEIEEAGKSLFDIG